MEIVSPLHIHLAAAEPPVRAQKEMVAEYIVFVTGERVAADVGKIADVVFVQADVSPSRFLAKARHQTDLTKKFFFGDAVPESRVTGAKDGAEDAATRRRNTSDDVSQTMPIA